MYDMHSKFDINLHQKHFVNYLEVVILPNGDIEYAVPSHQQFLIKYGAQIHNLSIEEFENLCPVEYYCNYLYWLSIQTHCVIVWSQGYFGIDITDKQRKVLDQFVDLKLMKDTILKV